MKMSKVMVCGLFTIAVPLSLPGQWQRIGLDQKRGFFTDVPEPHPLSYFTANPFLRDDSDDLCIRCTAEGKVQSGREYSIRTDVRPVGVLAGYHIVDALYYVSLGRNSNPDQAKWKSVLVQTGPDLYREIFHLQAFYTSVSLTPSRIIQSGSERVLATMDRDGGNGGGCWEGYWWFDQAGPHPLDFSRLKAAVEGRLPGNAAFNISCGNLNLNSEQVQSWVQRSDAQCHACDLLGRLTARFRLNGAIAEPGEIVFKSGDPNKAN
jgi:hypothetical protein